MKARITRPLFVHMPVAQHSLPTGDRETISSSSTANIEANVYRLEGYGGQVYAFRMWLVGHVINILWEIHFADQPTDSRNQIKDSFYLIEMSTFQVAMSHGNSVMADDVRVVSALCLARHVYVFTIHFVLSKKGIVTLGFYSSK